MKNHAITLAAVSLLALGGCTQLGTEDRKLLIETRNLAQESKVQAAQAAQSANDASTNAARAAQDAATAAAAAAAASEKADRIFQHSGDK